MKYKNAITIATAILAMCVPMIGIVIFRHYPTAGYWATNMLLVIALVVQRYNTAK